jgi:hypothetical protein
VRDPSRILPPRVVPDSPSCRGTRVTAPQPMRPREPPPPARTASPEASTGELRDRHVLQRPSRDGGSATLVPNERAPSRASGLTLPNHSARRHRAGSGSRTSPRRRGAPAGAYARDGPAAMPRSPSVRPSSNHPAPPDRKAASAPANRKSRRRRRARSAVLRCSCERRSVHRPEPSRRLPDRPGGGGSGRRPDSGVGASADPGRGLPRPFRPDGSAQTVPPGPSRRGVPATAQAGAP